MKCRSKTNGVVPATVKTITNTRTQKNATGDLTYYTSRLGVQERTGVAELMRSRGESVGLFNRGESDN